MKKTKLAVIGAGYMAEEHIKAFKDMPNLQVCGIFSRTKEKAQKIANRYNRELKDFDIELPIEHPDNKHAYYIYVVSHPERERIMSGLLKKDIHLNISYPWPIHIMDAYKHFVCSSCTCLKKTEENSKKIFSLPMYPTLTDEEQGVVIKELKQLI